MISIVICSIHPDRFAAISENYARLMRDEPFEIIGIHDAKSLCEGYNRGIWQSSGSILVFSHDDIEIITPDLAAKLKLHLRDHDMIGVVGTTKVVDGRWVSAGQPHVHGHFINIDPVNQEFVVNVQGASSTVVPGIQALDGLFFAARRKVVESLKFDQDTFDGFHLYDIDFSFSAYLAGFRLAVCNDISIIHASSGTFDKTWEGYRQRFMEKYRSVIPPVGTPTMQAGFGRFKTRQEILDYCTPERMAELTRRLRA